MRHMHGFIIIIKFHPHLINVIHIIQNQLIRNYSAYIGFNEHATRVFDQRIYNPYDKFKSRGF